MTTASQPHPLRPLAGYIDAAALLIAACLLFLLGLGWFISSFASWLGLFVALFGLYLAAGAGSWFNLSHALREAIWLTLLEQHWQAQPHPASTSFAQLEQDPAAFTAWLAQLGPELQEDLRRRSLREAVAWSNDIIQNEAAFRRLERAHAGLAELVRYHERFHDEGIGLLVLLPGIKWLLERFLVARLRRQPRPLAIDPQIQSYVWGREARESFILRFLGKRPAPGQARVRLAELWFGAHPKNPACARLGSLPIDLDRLADLMGERILGPGRTRIGQLFKVLDAVEPLSFQMHERYPPDSKNECWVVAIDRPRLISGGKEQTVAELYLGLRPVNEIHDEDLPGFKNQYLNREDPKAQVRVYRRAYAEALKKGVSDTEGRMIKAFHNHIEVRWQHGQVELYINGHKEPSEMRKRLGLDQDLLVLNIPGATAHALYSGAIFELQETADKTLRLYDHGRNDPQRPLHIQEAVEKMDFTPRRAEQFLLAPVRTDAHTQNLVCTPLYSLDRITLAADGKELRHPVRTGSSYQYLIVTAGEGQLLATAPGRRGVRSWSLHSGKLFFIPAGCEYQLATRGELKLLKAYEASPEELKSVQEKRGVKFWEDEGFFRPPRSNSRSREEAGC